MSFFKLKVSFSSNFASLFSVMKDNSSVLFQFRHYILCIKVTNQSANFRDLSALIKIHQILSFLKQQIRFSSNFASLFSVMKHNSSLYFYLNLYMLFTKASDQSSFLQKGTHQSPKFQTFDCSGEISPNLYFDRLLLLKVYKIQVTKMT